MYPIKNTMKYDGKFHETMVYYGKKMIDHTITCKLQLKRHMYVQW